jgi:hypothetical protein
MYRNLLEEPLGKPTRAENNIKTDFIESDFEGVNWIELGQDRAEWRSRLTV